MFTNYVVSDLLRSLTSAETATMAPPSLLTLSFYSLYQGEGNCSTRVMNRFAMCSFSDD
jgi:hypothetical protein